MEIGWHEASQLKCGPALPHRRIGQESEENMVHLKIAKAKSTMRAFKEGQQSR